MNYLDIIKNSKRYEAGLNIFQRRLKANLTRCETPSTWQEIFFRLTLHPKEGANAKAVPMLEL